MKIYRVEVDATLTRFNERSTHLVQAPTATKAIAKACREARQHGTYKRYDATSVTLLGEAI
jgi:hypothetical protein